MYANLERTREFPALACLQSAGSCEIRVDARFRSIVREDSYSQNASRRSVDRRVATVVDMLKFKCAKAAETATNYLCKPYSIMKKPERSVGVIIIVTVQIIPAVRAYRHNLLYLESR